MKLKKFSEITMLSGIIKLNEIIKLSELKKVSQIMKLSGIILSLRRFTFNITFLTSFIIK